MNNNNNKKEDKGVIHNEGDERYDGHAKSMNVWPLA